TCLVGGGGECGACDQDHHNSTKERPELRYADKIHCNPPRTCLFRFFAYLRGLICTAHANQAAAEPLGKRLRFKRHKGMLREREDRFAVDALAVSISCDA